MKVIASAFLKLLVVVVGAAGVALFIPSPEARPPEPKPTKISGVLHPAGISETGRSPVPLMRLVKAPWPEIASPTEPPPGLALFREQAAASRRVTESSARAAIERDGYQGVSGLTCNEGRCTGRALRGQTEISIMVESDGRVRSN
jgi:hypothetical protein